MLRKARMRMQEDKYRKNWSTGSESCKLDSYFSNVNFLVQEEVFIKGLARGINSQSGKKTL